MEQFRTAHYPEAQALLWTCIESGSGSGTDALNLAQTYRALKNYAPGLDKTNQLLKRFPESIDLLYLGAYLHFRRDETKDSMVLLSRAYRTAPNDWRLHQLFGLNYIRFDLLDAAKLSLLKAISLNGQNAELRYQLGRLYFTQNRFQDSIDCMRAALAIQPVYPEAYDSLGLTYEALKDEKSAAENYVKAIDLDVQLGIRDEWPLINYGTMLLNAESLEASLPLFRRALEYNDRSAKANYQMGRALRALHRNAEAEKFFQNTVDADPANANAYYQLAIIARNRGDRERSEAFMQKFKSLSEKEKKLAGSVAPR